MPARRRLGLAALAVIALLSAPVRAAPDDPVLLMFERPGCSWCEAWRREVGSVYEWTDEGRRLPLRVVDLAKPLPDDVATWGRDVVYTPTFVALGCGREAGRIVGYPGETNFYGLLGEIVGRLNTAPEFSACRTKPRADRPQGKGDQP